MALARVHNFSISLDGFATGEGQTRDAPFGHAGERLHQWMVATHWWHEMVGQSGGSSGIDDAFSQQFTPGIGTEIMGANKFGHPGWKVADWKTEGEHRGQRRNGHRRPVPRGRRRTLCRRRALTRGGAEVGCQDRRRLPLRTRSPGVHARPDRRQLDDTRLPACAGVSLDDVVVVDGSCTS